MEPRRVNTTPEHHDVQNATRSILPAGLDIREAGKVEFDTGLGLARPRKAGQHADRNLLAAEGLIRPHLFDHNILSIAVSSDAVFDGIGVAVCNDGIFRREALP